MISTDVSKRVLNKNGKTYTDEQVIKIMELFKFWAELEFSNYLKSK